MQDDRQASAGKIRFLGTQAAELFSREVDESIRGVLQYNFVSRDTGRLPAGFIRASIPGHFWDDTCWTRDAGGFLREAALWGYRDEAGLIAEYLMEHVQPNPEGYVSYPCLFRGRSSGFGDEMDGTAAIVTGMARLWQRLGPSPLRDKLYNHILGPRSPIALITKKLETEPLVSGSGEFGGGWIVNGDWYNVVQNRLVRQALLACAEIESAMGRVAGAGALRQDADRLQEHILRHLADPSDGTWIWALDPATMQPGDAFLRHPYTRGTASINGASSAHADAEGFEPGRISPPLADTMAATLGKVYGASSVRRELFGKFGMCTFVVSDDPAWLPGNASWLSYCDCFAAQTMILLGRTDLLDKVMTWIAASTYSSGRPSAEIIRQLADNRADIDWEGPVRNFWFTERNFSPEFRGDIEIGCWKLNLVNVAEPMKLARMMLGVDDRFADSIRLVPRLPDSWQGLRAENWPILTSRGVVRADIGVDRNGDGRWTVALSVREGGRIPEMTLRFPDGREVARREVDRLVVRNNDDAT